MMMMMMMMMVMIRDDGEDGDVEHGAGVQSRPARSGEPRGGTRSLTSPWSDPQRSKLVGRVKKT